MEWIDISVPIRPGMISFPGDPAVFMDRPIAIADGGVCNVSRLDFGVHSGTHVDAPVHFIEGAPGVDGMAIDSLVGPHGLSTRPNRRRTTSTWSTWILWIFRRV